MCAYSYMHVNASQMAESNPPAPGSWAAAEEGMFGGTSTNGGDGRDGERERESF